MNLNKVMLIGRLTSDPELRSTSGGQSVASFGLATNRNWTDKNGQKQEEATFHNIVVWARQAEIVSQFLKKGQLAYIEGRLQIRKWQDQQGQNRWTTEVIAERVQFGPKAAGASSVGSGNAAHRLSNFPGSTARDASDEVEIQIPEIDIDDDEIKPEEVPF